MPELETTQQVLAYLEQIQPGVTFNAYPFENGWICMEDLPPEEMLGRGLGMASLIVDKETAVVTVQSSLPMDLVAQKYAQAKRLGRPLPGRQIYPNRWGISLQKTREDDQRIEHQLTAQSLTDPPEPTQQFPITIDKKTFYVQPPGQLARRAMSQVEHLSGLNQGVWPDTAETKV